MKPVAGFIRSFVPSRRHSLCLGGFVSAAEYFCSDCGAREESVRLHTERSALEFTHSKQFKDGISVFVTFEKFVDESASAPPERMSIAS